jgi:caffeoyl-CoA O-methyltransferase
VFHDIPEKILKRMQYLERLDAQHRRQGASDLERLRQVPPATGKLLAFIAATAPEGRYLEIGTSGGYSTLWLSLACRARGLKITTFEVVKAKAKLAMETFREAGVEDLVDLVVGDARTYLDAYGSVAFCFLDAEKVYYQDCYNALVPNLVSGGMLVADNIISHQEILGPFVRNAMKDSRVDALIDPTGSGLLLCRRQVV